MAKKNKSVLNQNIENETINDNEDVEIISTNDFDESIEKDLSEMVNDNIPQYPIVDVKLTINEVEKPIIVTKPKRSLDSLSKSEYRMYLRTGIIPK
jgi:hypothetical protein